MPDINMKVDLGFDPSLAAPSKLFMVKGWNRSVCCLTTLWAMFELPGLYEAGCHLQPGIPSICVAICPQAFPEDTKK